MIYTVYNSINGIPTGLFYDADYNYVVKFLNENQSLFEGSLNAEYDRVDVITKNAIYAPQSVIDKYNNKPTEYFAVWDKNTQEWIDLRTQEDKFKDAVDKALKARSQLLLSSDWTQLPNGPLTLEQQQTWATYRQALRDITKQSGYPFNIIWPSAPN